MFAYPIEVMPDNGGMLYISCPLLPSVAAFAESDHDVPNVARHAIEAALLRMMSDGETIALPTDSTTTDIDSVRLSHAVSLRVSRYLGSFPTASQSTIFASRYPGALPSDEPVAASSEIASARRVPGSPRHRTCDHPIAFDRGSNVFWLR